MKHLIDITDFTVEEVQEVLDLADDILADRSRYAERLRGKILATLFFEPSTRTRLSFESAMLSLGGSVLGFSSADSSSTSKGETVSDTIRTVGCYCDIIAMRHPKEGAPMAAVREKPRAHHQRRGRRAQPSHPDPHRPAHHPPGKGPVGST